jgi:hypothetical protein
MATHNGRDRRYVADEIEIEFVVERGVDRVGCRDLEQRMAIRGCSDDCLRADITAGTGPALGDERLTKAFRGPLAYQAR